MIQEKKIGQLCVEKCASSQEMPKALTMRMKMFFMDINKFQRDENTSKQK